MRRFVTSRDPHRRSPGSLPGGSVGKRAYGAVLVAATALVLLLVALAVSPTGVGGARAAILPPTTSTTASPPDSTVKLPALHLPFTSGVDFPVSQGNGGIFTHEPRRPSEFAWDFAMPEGTAVVAAEAGTVVAVEAGMHGGDLVDRYAGRANYVLLAHPDGLFSLYLHLAAAGVLVAPGQEVAAGQPIALSGNTGYSSGPHLHFHVQSEAVPRIGQSVPVRFLGVGVPSAGASPISENTYRPPFWAPRVAAPGLLSPMAPTGKDRSQLVTGQRLPVSVSWASGGEAPVPVRLVTLDGSGDRRVVTTGTSADRNALTSIVTPTRTGWITVWAEYQDGITWLTCADEDGTLAWASYEVLPGSLFLEPPGITLRTGGTDLLPRPDLPPGSEVEIDAGESIEVSFAVRNVGTSIAHLLDVGGQLDSGDDLPQVFGRRRDLYVGAGKTAVWSGTATFPSAGRYVVRSVGLDAGRRPVALPPLVVGDPVEVTVVVKAIGEGGPDDDADDIGSDDDGADGGVPGGGAGSPAPAFVDVPESHPAYAAIQALAERGVISGYLDGGGARSFRPGAPLARAQFAKMLALVRGLRVSEDDRCGFIDVEDSGPAGFYPDNYIAAAASAGLLLGVGLDPPRFDPYGLMTRRQVALVAARAGLAGARVEGDQWAPATRGEVAILLVRLVTPTGLE